ncbi:endolytic transglycosylase MltG [Candidatus Saccharibacteria bacterium]|nr:endolytic transglycosylase MltG [Candidatus Saccharibacteria bacterium]
MASKKIIHTPQPINGQPSGLKLPKVRGNSKLGLWIGCGLTLAAILIIAGIFIWYYIQLSPVGNDKSVLKKVTITPGSTSSAISKDLEKQSIIRSSFVFDIYVRLASKNNMLRAGTYRLSPAESTQQIVEHFIKGSVDTFNITFYPGATLVDNTSKSPDKKQDVTSVLKRAGFTDQEIAYALDKPYYSPLFAGKPNDSSLEGYIYGETYNFNAGSKVEDILTAVFKEFYKKVQANNLVNGFAKHGLNLYQGVTLASIVQREASGANDQKQVAQVFYSRMTQGMTLGSDVTYQYIADRDGLVRDPSLDSPYNTRIKTGLPPGPIAVPGLSALLAVANPASGDYLYFLSGDDDVTYFARTNAEHEANVLSHCKVKCSTP